MPDTAAKPGVKTVLHVGCGSWRPDALHSTFQKPGWAEIRLDINPDVEPDIVASMTDMSQVQDGSVDAVWSSHSLEHLYAHEVPRALGEFYRVLRPNGSALVRVPDLEKAAEFVLQIGLCGIAFTSPSGPIMPLDILYGHSGAIAKGETAMQHKTGFTAQTLKRAYGQAGFSNVIVTQRNLDLVALGKKVD